MRFDKNKKSSGADMYFNYPLNEGQGYKSWTKQFFPFNC